MVTTKPSPTTVQEMTLFPGIHLTFELVDPARADELLANNTRNRLLSDGAVEAYSRSMIDGEWAFAGDPIRVAADGTLLDGQHRLNAVVKSGQPQWMLLIHGLSLAVQAKIDVGRKRDVAQQLTIQGVPNASAVAATARLYMTWMHWVRHRTGVQWTNPQVTSFALDRIAYIHPAIQAAASARRELPVSGPAVAAAYMRAAEITDAFHAERWFDRLATGVDLKMGDPVHSLRRSLLQGPGPPRSDPGAPPALQDRPGLERRRQGGSSQVHAAAQGRCRCRHLPRHDPRPLDPRVRMTAHNSYRLRCDGRPAPSSEGAGPAACPSAYRGEEGRTVTQVRADALDEDGWDYRRNGRGRWVDLCPTCASTRADTLLPAHPPVRPRLPCVDTDVFDVPLTGMIRESGFSRDALAGMVADGVIAVRVPEEHGRFPTLDRVRFRERDLILLRSEGNRADLRAYHALGDVSDSDLARGSALGTFIRCDRSR